MENENLKTIYIDEVGSNEFMIFNQKDKQILNDKYRIVCENICKAQNSLVFLPLIILPEQVQILIENGIAKVRKIHKLDCAEPSTSSNFLFQNNLNLMQQKKTKNIMDVRQISINKKIKKFKRKKLKLNVLSDKLKIKKADKKSFTNLLEKDITCAANKFFEDKVQKLNFKKHCNLQINFLQAPIQCYKIVENPQFPKDALYRRRIITFRDLWRKGFYLTSGTKFGCDYLAYEKPPSKIHSKFMVICVDTLAKNSNEKNDFNNGFSCLNLISAARVATQVKKHILLSIVSPESLIPYYIECNWWKGNK